MNIESFYRENYPIVYGYLVSLCGDRYLAEDLTSETFLKAIVKIGSYDGRVKVSTWLCTIGRNLYLNEKKKAKRYLPLEEAMAACEVDMEAQCIQSLRDAQIRATIQTLGEPASIVVKMWLQKLSFREIGDTLGKSEGWARVTFFRAKEKLMKELEESE